MIRPKQRRAIHPPERQLAAAPPENPPLASHNRPDYGFVTPVSMAYAPQLWGPRVVASGGMCGLAPRDRANYQAHYVL